MKKLLSLILIGILVLGTVLLTSCGTKPQESGTETKTETQKTTTESGTTGESGSKPEEGTKPRKVLMTAGEFDQYVSENV